MDLLTDIVIAQWAVKRAMTQLSRRDAQFMVKGWGSRLSNHFIGVADSWRNINNRKTNHFFIFQISLYFVRIQFHKKTLQNKYHCLYKYFITRNQNGCNNKVKRNISALTENIKLNFVPLRGITIIVSIRNQHRQWLGAPKNSIKAEIGISALLSRDSVAGSYLNRTAMSWAPQLLFPLPWRKKYRRFF